LLGFKISAFKTRGQESEQGRRKIEGIGGLLAWGLRGIGAFYFIFNTPICT
jgi:hypothetical protein